MCTGGFPGGSAGKESTCNAGDPGSIPGLGRSPGEGISYPLQYSWSSLVVQMVKNPLQCGIPGFDSCIGKIPWRRAWQPCPMFLPGESHAQRSPVGSSPQGHKESDTTERLSTAQHGAYMSLPASRLSLHFPLTLVARTSFPTSVCDSMSVV